MLETTVHQLGTRRLASLVPGVPAILVHNAAGFLLFCVSGLGLWWTFRHGNDHLLRVLALAGGVSVVFSWLLVIVSRWTLRRSLDQLSGKQDANWQCGVQSLTSWKLSWWSRNVVNVSCRWLSPRAEVTFSSRGEEQATPYHRAWAKQINRRLEIADPFGLAWMAFQHEQRFPITPLKVFPKRNPPDKDPLALIPRAVIGGEESAAQGERAGDLLDFDRYRQGDSMRLILWKLVARRGSQRSSAGEKIYYVRRPEVVTDTRLALYFLTADREDDASAELALYFLQEPLRGRTAWVMGFSTDKEPAANVDDSERLLLKSGIDQMVELPIQKFMQTVAQSGITTCIIFLPLDGSVVQECLGQIRDAPQLNVFPLVAFRGKHEEKKANEIKQIAATAPIKAECKLVDLPETIDR